MYKLCSKGGKVLYNVMKITKIKRKKKEFISTIKYKNKSCEYAFWFEYKNENE